ncbi:uncharacterized protein BCR38DRAFT_481605 [Pseudomassariella vexata]|uniref:Uncharacterized protein n=1 Tax=Pseudomassariella vexata TaxID=1141098 RepID=A0A1Y2EFX6_9PEZI|nr:uncharacterized protein BCR38DRAFT_481605 [Pseudomassariella vexata]ORY70471.1 hypothetical protein BCR38DRAFT_481605 [Pseudomassariella vexata]
MFGQVYRSGWVDAAVEILTSSDPEVAVLPHSNTPIVLNYTGWTPLDKLMGLAAIIFANVVDGFRPQLSLYAYQFGGQLVPVFAVMMIEGLRVGNRHNCFYYTILWGYAMQIFGYATVMPLYCGLHLLSSPVALNNPQAVRPLYLAPLYSKAIIPAFGLGYGLLTFLFAYPFESGNTRQWFCAIWQGFPTYVVGTQYLLAALTSSPRIRKPKNRHERHCIEALSQAYNFAFNVGAATQLFTLAVIGLAKISPSVLPHIFRNLSFRNVFKPGPFFSMQPMISMAAEMHSFLLYDQYCGSVAAIIWSSTLYISAHRTSLTKWKDYARLGGNILRWSAIGGPGGAMVRLLQQRDEKVLSGIAADESTKER